MGGKNKKKRNENIIKLIFFGVVSALCLVAIVLIFKWEGPLEKTEEWMDLQVKNTQQESVKLETLQEQKIQEETQEESQEETKVSYVTISAVGDCILGRHQEQGYEGSFDAMYDCKGEDYFMQNVYSIFAADDFTIANCECVLTESDERMEDKKWSMKGRPRYANLFKNASIEAVSLGNNHIDDYYRQGAEDTMKNLTDAGVIYSIKGQYTDRNGLYKTKEGIKIGFVSVSKLNVGFDNTYKYLQEGLAAVKAEGADLTIACIHWGKEGEHYATGEQQNIGRWCVDQGFDLVLGCHPHVLQGIEKYKDKYIVYSLGNFCFGGNKNPVDKETMIFQETFQFVDGELQVEDSQIKIIPCQLSSSKSQNDYCPIVLEGQEGETVIEHINEYSASYGFSYTYEP